MIEFVEQFNNAQRSSSEIISKLTKLADSHIQLYKEEAKENKNRLYALCLLLIAGTATGTTAIIATSFFLFQLMIDNFKNLSQIQALGIMALVLILISSLILLFACNMVKKISFSPTATISSLKESYKCLTNTK